MMLFLLLKFMLCSAIFFGAYKLLLEKDGCHYFKRYYLLSSFLFAAIVPFINISIPTGLKEELPAAAINYVYEQFIPASADTSSFEPAKPETGKINYPVIIYLIVCFILLSRFIKSLLALIKLTKTNERIADKGMIYIMVKDPVTPFSFLNYIVVNKEEYNSNQIEKEILQHEAAHVTQRHTWDNIFIELVTCFLWINPVIFLYRKAIQLNHEFLADQAVMKQNNDAPFYLNLLITKSIPHTSNQLASSFNFLTIKKRITMITRKPSRIYSLLRRIAILPVAFLALYIFSNKIVAQQTPSQVNQPSQNNAEPRKYRFFSIVKPGPGATDKEIEEYNAIIKKIKKEDSNIYDWKNMDRNDGKKLQSIFKKMNMTQRNQLEAWVSETTFGPFAPAIPSESQLEAFKNASVYGVWVDGKKIANTQLNNYQASDFRHYSISKLYGAAKKGRSYTHQLNLMTIPYYEEYRKETIEENEKSPIIVIAPSENLKNRKGALDVIVTE